MSEVFHSRSAPQGGAEGQSQSYGQGQDPGGLPPLDDPYFVRSDVPRRSALSPLALTSVIAPIVGGPLGSIAAIVFGWAARREIRRAPGPRRGYVLATIGMAMGLCTTIAWGALIAFGVWSSKHREEHRMVAMTSISSPASDSPTTPAAPAGTAPEASAVDRAAPTMVPRETSTRHEGLLTVVDVGTSVSSLAQELAKQRAAASILGETVLMMTTRDGCEPCQHVSEGLRDPLMQTALIKVRLVRVDTEVFKEDLEGLKMPYKRIPGFFLLALDLYPRDAIDGGEWDEDVPQNIAPVLGAFVRGKYQVRRLPWQPIPGTGIRL